MTKKEFTIGISENFYNLLESEIKKLGLNSKSEFYNFLTEKYFTGGSTNPALTVEQQLKLEQLKKIQFENQEIKEIKKRKIEAETKIKEYHANHLDVIGSNPSQQAKNAMNHYVGNKQPYDENAIYCPECTWHTNSKDSINWQIDRITDHMKNTHHRSFTEDEAKIISELLK